MKKRNIYKDLVWGAVGCVAVALATRAGSFWLDQQKNYDFSIYSKQELTKSTVEELKNLPGLYEFTPTISCEVTLKLEEYTMETSVIGLMLDSYPLKWKSACKEVALGSNPVLFFGKDSFTLFADDNGASPGKSQISEWIKQYETLEVTLTDAHGQVKEGSISGILKEPSQGIYMENHQMQEIFGKNAKTAGGHIKLQGQQNMYKAKEILQSTGFLVE